MKKLLILLSLCLTITLFGQKVTTESKSERIKGESADGYSTTLEGKKADVEAAWAQFIYYGSNTIESIA